MAYVPVISMGIAVSKVVAHFDHNVFIIEGQGLVANPFREAVSNRPDVPPVKVRIILDIIWYSTLTG